MEDAEFQKMEREWKERLSKETGREIPPGIRENFSAEVLKKIQATPPRQSGSYPFLVPMLSAAVILMFVLWGVGQQQFLKTAVPDSILIEEPAAALDLAEELAILEALEVWTDEDFRLAGWGMEEPFRDLDAVLPRAAAF